MEERAARGAAAMVADLASSLKGWLPSPLRAGRAQEAGLPPPDDWRPAEMVADDGTRSATSLLLAPRRPLLFSPRTFLGHSPAHISTPHPVILFVLLGDVLSLCT